MAKVEKDIVLDYAEYLKNESGSGTSVYHSYRMDYQNQENTVFIFLEGHDDCLFYKSLIRRKDPNLDIVHYNCKGKGQVVRTKILIEKDMSIKNCLFFVDRDYDDFFNEQAEADEHLYITDFYSIENHLASEYLLSIICTDLVGLNKIDTSYKGIIKDYKVGVDIFYNRIKPFIVWSLAMREASEKPTLNSVNLNNIFKFNDNLEIEEKSDAWCKYKKMCSISNDNVDAEVKVKWEALISSLQEKEWVRGKFELWYFQEFLIKKLEHLKTIKEIMKVPNGVSQRCVFELIGNRIECPDSLEKFLNSKLQ